MWVNGSLTHEIKIKRGLKQGHPLSLFLFLLAVEGINGLFRRASDLIHFYGFKVGPSGLEVSPLQFVDDNLILVDL